MINIMMNERKRVLISLYWKWKKKAFFDHDFQKKKKTIEISIKIFTDTHLSN